MKEDVAQERRVTREGWVLAGEEGAWDVELAGWGWRQGSGKGGGGGAKI